MLLRLCLITSSSSTKLKFFCICLHFFSYFFCDLNHHHYIYCYLNSLCFFPISFDLLHPYHHCHFSNVCCNCWWISRYFAKSSPPSKSFKLFCICLTFSYFLLSLRSYQYHPFFLFRCISFSFSTWSYFVFHCNYNISVVIPISQSSILSCFSSRSLYQHPNCNTNTNTNSNTNTIIPISSVHLCLGVGLQWFKQPSQNTNTRSLN